MTTTQPPMKDPSVLSVFIGVYRWSISKKNVFYQAQGILRLHIQFTSGVIPTYLRNIAVITQSPPLAVLDVVALLYSE
jgi:hypothetical protein